MKTIDSISDAKPESPQRRRFTDRDRKRLLNLFKRSGQGAVEFGRENDVCASSLWRWLARERRCGEGKLSESGLVEVPMAALSLPEQSSKAVSVQVAGVARLEVVVGTDPQWLGELVRALLPARE